MPQFKKRPSAHKVYPQREVKRNVISNPHSAFLPVTKKGKAGGKANQLRVPLWTAPVSSQQGAPMREYDSAVAYTERFQPATKNKRTGAVTLGRWIKVTKV